MPDTSRCQSGRAVVEMRFCLYKAIRGDVRDHLVSNPFKRESRRKEFSAMFNHISEVAQALDEDSWYGYRIAQLQKLRKHLRGLGCQAGSGIFQFDRHENQEKDYAYHWGGRDECQFNIQFLDQRDGNYIEYGLAFSLDTVRGRSILGRMRPRIVRFNQFVERFSSGFENYRIGLTKPRQDIIVKAGEPTIHDAWIEDGNFISFFNLNKEPANPLGVQNILSEFDKLIPLYEFSMS